MPPPKLHLNEHLSPRLAEQLRKYGFDATSTLEVGMVEADDDEQLAYAASSAPPSSPGYSRLTRGAFRSAGA